MSKVEPWLVKMDRSERAKQFMPFAALKGYEEALRAKEAEVEAMHREERYILSESGEDTGIRVDTEKPEAGTGRGINGQENAPDD